MNYDLAQEEVPPFKKRIGDVSFEGSNGTIVILGTDRAKDGPASLSDGLGHPDATGKGKGTGTVHVIAGRSGPDPDMKKDAAFLYVTAKSNVDENLGLSSVEKNLSGKSAFIGKADGVRLIFRENMKISSENAKNYVYVDGDYIIVKIGANFVKLNGTELTAEIGQSKIKATAAGIIDLKNPSCNVNMDPIRILAKGPMFKIGGPAGQQWIGLLSTILSAAVNHIHMTAVGPTSPAAGPVAGTPSPSFIPLVGTPPPPNTAIMTKVNAALKLYEQTCFEP
jgi:hypothetical protein